VLDGIKNACDVAQPKTITTLCGLLPQTGGRNGRQLNSRWLIRLSLVVVHHLTGPRYLSRKSSSSLRASFKL
jgi:hypothetical protein